MDISGNHLNLLKNRKKLESSRRKQVEEVKVILYENK